MALRKILIFLLALVVLSGCNLPLEPVNEGASPTPYIIYVTATSVAGTEGQPQVGPFQHTLVPTSPYADQPPTLDLSGLTLFPTPTLPGSSTPESGETATPTPTPTATLTPTITPTPVTPLPTGTPTPVPPTSTPTPVPPTSTPVPPPDASYIPELGINFISSAQHPADQSRVQAGLDAGAEWDRFAIYWSDIEQTKGKYTWGLYDGTVNVDVAYGLKTNAILLGTPKIRADGRGVPVDMDEPVFADGTDVPASGKAINPENPWAAFVFATVSRYKPGGTLAQQQGWPTGAGIRLWEIWNEPDFSQFWGGTVDEYARLLKVAYLAARQADPYAEIMIGGLVLFEQPYFFANLLNIYKNDPAPVAVVYPFDKVAVHSYSSPPYTFYVVQDVESLLVIYGLGHIPVWLNESGVAVWDDYPGPNWATRSDQIIWRATLSEQADYIVQSAAYAIMADAEAIFHFQLYDDCGNQPAGTTFAPHNGELCDTGAVCWGDALGLMRNTSDNTCFNQHPEPDTPRPGYTAFQVVRDIFTQTGVVPLTAYSFGAGGGTRLLRFARPATGEIITLLWNETDQVQEAVLPARAEEGSILVTRFGESAPLTPGEDGSYHILLDPATNRNQNGGGFMIGGPPVFIIEPADRPLVSVLPLLDDSSSAFLVKWRASDQNISKYEIWYRDDTGENPEWVLWFEADSPGEALFVGGSGRRYSFFARGLLPDGTWTLDDPGVQAWTRVK